LKEITALLNEMNTKSQEGSREAAIEGNLVGEEHKSHKDFDNFY
jgi:hypothetical protein